MDFDELYTFQHAKGTTREELDRISEGILALAGEMKEKNEMAVIILRGLPGCGKSTWAKEQLTREPDRYKIINKDSLRAMFDDSGYSPKKERFILRARDILILLALEEGYIPIVDDTNLNEKHIQSIRALVEGTAEVQIKDFTDVPLEVCIERDKQRVNPIGEQVIRDMWQRFFGEKP